jgi:hypothetical protein
MFVAENGDDENEYEYRWRERQVWKTERRCKKVLSAKAFWVFSLDFFSSKDTVITSVNKKVNTTKNWEKGERMRGRWNTILTSNCQSTCERLGKNNKKYW